MRDAIANITNKIKKTIKSINFKSKKTLLFIGLFVFALTTSLILISYGYYVKPGDKTLVVSGYALVSDADITLKIYIEDKDSNGKGAGTYSRAYYIPTTNYTYNKSSSYCTEGIKIDSFANGKFDITSTSKGYCKVYFDAVDGYAPDATFKLYVEQTKGSGDYEEAGMLPDNDYVYKVNTTRTTCTDPNAVVEVVKRKIEITTSMDNTCTVYVDIEALTGGAINFLSDTILAKADGTERNSNQENGGVYVIKQEMVTYNGTTYDAGVRYEGNDPDNYVLFNGNEEWRIIGVFEGSTIGLEPGKQYTKIIRNTPMYKAWDCTDNNSDGDCNDAGEYENDWVNSTLNAYLNGTYLSGLTDSDKIAQYNGNYSTWYIRGLTGAQHSRATTSDWYLAERITGSSAPNAEATTTGAIGLMYPSDYGYGAYGSACDNAPYKDLYNYESGCASVDWLLLENDWEWLISPYPDSSIYAFSVYGFGGGDVSYYSVYYEWAARPVLYLEASVGIDTGEGTKANPYKLS